MAITTYARIDENTNIIKYVIKENHSLKNVAKRLKYKTDKNEIFQILPEEAIYTAISDLFSRLSLYSNKTYSSK